MAASLEDLALAYRIMASPDPANPASASFPDPLTCIPGPNSSAPKTIGVYRDWIKRADPAVLTLFDKTIEYYRDQKFYTIVDISIPYLPEGQKAHALTILTDICSTVTKEQISQATPSNRILLSMAGNQAAAQDFIAAQRMRNLLMRHLAHLYQKYPGLIIATPTVPIAGWKIAKGEADLAEGVSEPDTTLRTMEYVYLANFTGCPALSWPMGYATNGGQMPVGIMGMGEWGSEESLIAWARDGEGILDVVEGSRPLTTEDDTVKDTEEPSAAAPKDGKTGPRIPSGKGAKWVDVVALAREYRANLDQGLLPSLGLTPPISI
jgi:Asp-tRNA(Asn)/Glu-tRNA(Gln) amidotransferase A subunit family amidase